MTDEEVRYIHIVVEGTCQGCPFAQYDGDYGISYDSGWDCGHDEGAVGRIVDDWEVSNSNNKKPKGWPPIPDGCPLPKTERSE